MGYYPRLRDLREDKDLSIRELADLLHMHRTTYYNYETGKRLFLPSVASFILNVPSLFNFGRKFKLAIAETLDFTDFIYPMTSSSGFPMNLI